VITKCSYGDKNKEDEISRACGRHRGKINANRVLVGKSEGKKTGPTNRQKDNKQHCNWQKQERVQWIKLAQKRDTLRTVLLTGSTFRFH